MIAFIKGTLEEIQENCVVVDTGGIGYAVSVSEGTVSRLPRRGEAVTLHTHMSVREDGAELFGFLTGAELAMFKRLITVSGVGPKVALGILSVMEPSQIMLAIIAEDAAALSRAPGVGRKTAGRLILELKDRVKTSDAFIQNAALPQQTFAAAGSRQEAADALAALGYSRSEAVNAVLGVDGEDLSTEQIIKAALRKLSKY